MLAMATPAAARECVRSPGAVLELCVSVADGQALYAVMRGGTEVIAPSRLGLAFAGEADPRYTAITSTPRRAPATTWEQPWGEQRLIPDQHRALKVTLAGDNTLRQPLGRTFPPFDHAFRFH